MAPLGASILLAAACGARAERPEADASADAGDDAGPDAAAEPPVEEAPELCLRPPGAWQVETVLDLETDDYAVACLAAGEETAFIALRQTTGLDAAMRDQNGWTTEVIDPTGLEVLPSCAEHAGSFAVAYGGADHFLRVATRRDGAWEPRGILEVPWVWAPSLAIDAEEDLHVSYVALHGDGTSDLRYAWADGPSWATTTLASGPHVSQFSAVAVDRAGRFQVVFGAGTPDGRRAELRHAVGVGDDWSSTVILEPVDYYPLGLALGPRGAPHLATFQFAGGPIHVTFRDGRWVEEEVDSFGYWTGESVPLGVDARGNVHLAYAFSTQAGIDPEVRYATNETGAWETETLEPHGSFGGFALDPLGRPHVVFVVRAPDVYELRHAWREAEPCAP